MKFNCGPKYTEEERTQRLADWRKEVREWKPKFAWLPTKVDRNDCRWLEWIEWRGEWNSREYRNWHSCLGFWVVMFCQPSYWYVKEYRAKQ